MPKIQLETRLKNAQAAQGMVEFALVLPILLLIILGVFGFGHLFFAYSSVVSASREAARWGSAAGVAGSSRPRYYDCNAIRAAAVRVGNFAGVSAVDAAPGQPGIAIWFDHGPNDPSAVYPGFDNCTDDKGPSVVNYGDRVNVSVTVNYHSIVPLVNIPDFPLTGVTARTIVKNLPVGEAPTAEPVCPTTNIVMQFVPVPMPDVLPAWPVVGQPLDVWVKVTASDNKSPTGTVDINDDTGLTCSVASNSTTWQVCHLVPKDAYPSTITHLISARYAWDNHGQCYQPSEIIDEPLDVIKADTVTTVIKAEPNPSYKGEDVHVFVQVTALSPGTGIPTGQVKVSDQAGDTCTIANLVMGAGDCVITPNKNVKIYATYQGDTNYNSSTSNAIDHQVNQPPTLTPTITPTRTVRVTATPTPTITPRPTRTLKPSCPSLVTGSDSYPTNAFQFQISNAGGTAAAVSSVEVLWPFTDPPAELKTLYFDTANPAQVKLAEAKNNNAALTPKYWVIPSSNVSNWNWYGGSLAASASKYMRLAFSSDAPSGLYFVTVNFDNGCSVDVLSIH